MLLGNAVKLFGKKKEPATKESLAKLRNSVVMMEKVRQPAFRAHQREKKMIFLADFFSARSERFSCKRRPTLKYEFVRQKRAPD